jgi:hypothetical protein
MLSDLILDLNIILLMNLDGLKYNFANSVLNFLNKLPKC